MKRTVLTIALLCIGAAALSPALRNVAFAKFAQADMARDANDLLTRNYSAGGPGAAVLVARGDTVLFRGARGLADMERKLPLRPESVFRIGSATKQFTAAGLLTLVEAGKVRLDDPLSKYVPDFPGGDRITVLQLLNHTSGLGDYIGLPGFREGGSRRDMTTAEIIDLFKNEKPAFAPGSNWAYSNAGYVLVGAVIEAASGMPWHVYLDQVFFKPLGMRHTGYGHDPKFAGQQVQGFSYHGEAVVPMFAMSMTQPHAAGALVSNVDDLLKWNRALHEVRLLKSATYNRMITPVGAAAASGVRYGFGVFNDTVRGRPELWHGGRIFGFIASLSYLPGPDITVVVLENDDIHDVTREGIDDAYPLARRLAAMALGDPYPEMTAVPVDAAVLQAAEGVYRFAGGATRTLRMVDGKLTAQRDKGQRQVLTPIAADDFLYPDGFNRLKLTRDAGGKIAGMLFFAKGDGAGEVGIRTNEKLPAAPVGMQLPRAALERLVGTYANSELTLTVFIEGEALKSQIDGQPPVGLRAVSSTQFDVEEAPATLEFSGGDAPAGEVTIRQNGRETVLRRVS
jgi:D-alanyl-D-alanine carboxypeptidase